MADTLKVLGQSKPLATTLTDAYTAPSSAAVSSIVVTNQSGTATSYRISVAVAGAADTPKQYIVYDAPILGNETQSLTLGVSLASTDVIRVYNTLATVSFNIFGVEVA